MSKPLNPAPLTCPPDPERERLVHALLAVAYRFALAQGVPARLPSPTADAGRAEAEKSPEAAHE
ncbi:MAG: hypothetical protein HYZ49_08600 [Chloroflexi bacterium]|nr:hypothetical protein [Chloroflexota bacterium]